MTAFKEISEKELNYINSRWELTENTVFWKNGKNSGKPVCLTCRPSGHQNIYIYYNKKLRGYVLTRI